MCYVRLVLLLLFSVPLFRNYIFTHNFCVSFLQRSRTSFTHTDSFVTGAQPNTVRKGRRKMLLRGCFTPALKISSSHRENFECEWRFALNHFFFFSTFFFSFGNYENLSASCTITQCIHFRLTLFTHKHLNEKFLAIKHRKKFVALLNLHF